MPSHYLTHELGKLKPNIENSGGSALKRLRFDLGCNTIAAAAAAAAAVVC
jgi:hypothetical protein